MYGRARTAKALSSRIENPQARELEKVRIKEIRRSKTPASMLALSDAFDSAMQNYVIPKTPFFYTTFLDNFQTRNSFI
jgi:hypothetical protein